MHTQAALDPRLAPADAPAVSGGAAAPVLKRCTPGRARVEWLKGRAAAAIGRETGLFRVPHALVLDPAAGTIAFEREHGLVDLRRALRATDRPRRLAARAGRALAAIHERLRLEPELRVPAPGLEPGDAPVFLHGDYSVENVHVDRARDELVVFDWAAPSWLGGGATFGPAAVDLGIFLQSLFARRMFGHGPPRDVESVARGFLEAYARERGGAFRPDELRAAFPVLLEQYLTARRGQLGRLRYLAHLPSYRRARAFATAFEASDETEVWA